MCKFYGLLTDGSISITGYYPSFPGDIGSCLVSDECKYDVVSEVTIQMPFYGPIWKNSRNIGIWSWQCWSLMRREDEPRFSARQVAQTLEKDENIELVKLPQGYDIIHIDDEKEEQCWLYWNIFIFSKWNEYDNIIGIYKKEDTENIRAQIVPLTKNQEYPAWENAFSKVPAIESAIELENPKIINAVTQSDSPESPFWENETYAMIWIYQMKYEKMKNIK